MHVPPSSSASVYASREVETLRYQSIDFELSLTDNRGRSVDLSFSSEQLNYSRTYNQFGAVATIGKQHDTATIMDEARQFIGGAIAEQGRAVAQHESQSLDYSSLNLNIEGDVSLLSDYFASDVTAQRIFDFVTGLNPGLDAHSDAFSNFADEIQKGVAEGFAQAQHLLGELPEVSNETRSLLDIMLAQFKEDPAQVSSAASLLASMHEDDDEQSPS